MDWMADPGGVLQRIQASDFETLCELMKVGLVDVDVDVGPVIDSITGEGWAALADSLFDEVLSFFRPEVRQNLSVFLRELSQQRKAILQAIQAELGGISPSNSSEKPESTSTTGLSETSSPLPEAEEEPNGLTQPA